jgi:hypothetical protein
VPLSCGWNAACLTKDVSNEIPRASNRRAGGIERAVRSPIAPTPEGAPEDDLASATEAADVGWVDARPSFGSGSVRPDRCVESALSPGEQRASV